MRRILTLLSFLILSIGIFPVPVLAGSCVCTVTNNIQGSRSSCLSNTLGLYTANSQADCDEKNNNTVNTAGTVSTYTDCKYCASNDCSGCNQQGTEGLTKMDGFYCSTDDQCKQNAGNGYCYNGVCWLDARGFESYQLNHVTFMGVSRDIKLQKPIIEIRIPGVEFKDSNQSVDSQGFIHVDYLPQYLAAIYSFSMIAASMVAVVIIILNGFRIAVSAGGEEKNKGIQNVTKAVTGLFLLWSSYALFYTINPALTQFKAMSVKYVEPVPIESEEPFSENPQDVATMLSSPIGTNIQYANGVQVSDTLLPNLKTAAASLINQNIVLYVSSGIRDLEKQKSLIKQNCTDPNDPKTCSPPTCMLKNGDPKNCPHTTGKAVDVWGYQGGKQCKLQKECSSNPDIDACRKDPCQKAIIDAMKSSGFCNLRSEAWHFELPKMSGSCS